MPYLAALCMQSKTNTYPLSHAVSAVFMGLALLWLTISTPFVFASEQYFAKYNTAAGAKDSFPASEEETTNPFGNSTEEKKPGSNSFSEEYLHDPAAAGLLSPVSNRYRTGENADTYHAFHGELLVPPPNAA